MNENSQQNSQFTGLTEKPEFNLPELLFSYLRYWYWFILVIAASLFVAYLYLRYSTPVYVVRSEIIIKDDKGGLSQNNILSELDIFNTKNNAGDEIEILKTRYLMEKVVEELELNVSYYAPGKIKTSELYNTSPFYVTILSPKDSIVVQQFHLHILDGAGFLLENDSIKINRHFEKALPCHL